MGSITNWLIIVGFFLVLVAVALRIFMMMRASDLGTSGSRTEYGRGLLRLYRTAFPKSPLPELTMTVFLIGGLAMLTGLGVHFSR